ncbi:GFA family protein [Stagnimonas aquatica]|uniref:GFA family protein n=1 Tax=Stagnimonas aquatica TaxID=2689987 RepID=A0A3N0V1S2_9GAMM|nr:GFA family protein [Stagnimonas aquatica]ROH86481.1 GFA family protein [Stagnimonas aquatica]
MSDHRGSCLCGGVRYVLRAPLTEIGLCHCQQCRKANGSAFAANAPVPEAAFQLLAGAELLKAYESSPGKQRVFCGHCGSPIYSRNAKKPGLLRLRIGLLDTPAGHTPDFHFMTAHKADWHQLDDALPQYPEYPPER